GARRLLEVDGDGPARAVPHCVAAVLAEGVSARRLDLDHVGTLLGEQERAERAGDAPREIEHPHSVQGTGAVRPPNGRWAHGRSAGTGWLAIFAPTDAGVTFQPAPLRARTWFRCTSRT